MLRISNISIARQLSYVKPQVRWQNFHTSSVIKQATASNETGNPEIKIYYGKSSADCENFH
jgi:hypothetical protein